MASHLGSKGYSGSGVEELSCGPKSGYSLLPNLTSFGVGYFTIDSNTNDGIFRKDILDAMPAVDETDYVRHVRFPRPFRILMDGMKQEGAVVLSD